MLKLKYIPDLINSQPFLLITGEHADYTEAYEFYRNQHRARLNESLIVTDYGIAPLQSENLLLTTSECQRLSKHYRLLSKSQEPAHFYFSTEALRVDLEVLISYREYDALL